MEFLASCRCLVVAFQIWVYSSRIWIAQVVKMNHDIACLSAGSSCGVLGEMAGDEG